MWAQRIHLKVSVEEPNGSVPSGEQDPDRRWDVVWSGRRRERPEVGMVIDGWTWRPDANPAHTTWGEVISSGRRGCTIEGFFLVRSIRSKGATDTVLASVDREGMGIPSRSRCTVDWKHSGKGTCGTTLMIHISANRGYP